jgi:hypothetical protein
MCIGYACSEARAGGPNALVSDGDIVEIDASPGVGTIHLALGDIELAARAAPHGTRLATSLLLSQPVEFGRCAGEEGVLLGLGAAGSNALEGVPQGGVAAVGPAPGSGGPNRLAGAHRRRRGCASAPAQTPPIHSEIATWPRR